MLTASRILGDQVGSTAPVFLAVLAVHVTAGLTAVITGAAAALSPQGRPASHPGGPLVLPGHHRSLRHRDDPGRDALAAGLLPVHHRRCGVHRCDHRLPSSAAAASLWDSGHIAGMGIAYVALLTAFYVDNGPHLPLWDRLPTFAFWLLPSAVGAPVIIRAIRRARRAPGPAVTRQAAGRMGKPE